MPPLPTGGSTRIKGNALSLELDSVDYWMDITSCSITNDDADNDVTTFYDAANGGGKAYTLAISAIQSLDADSFWRYAWENQGQNVPFIYAPKGNHDAPTADQPWFVGTVTIGQPPVIGGDAGADETYTTDLEWAIDGKPLLVTTNPDVG